MNSGVNIRCHRGLFIYANEGTGLHSDAYKSVHITKKRHAKFSVRLENFHAVLFIEVEDAGCGNAPKSVSIRDVRVRIWIGENPVSTTF